MEPLFYKIFTNITRCYRGRYLFFQVVMVVLTYMLVVSGFDWWYFKNTAMLGTSALFFLPALIGFFVPVVVPFSLLLVGYIKKSSLLKNTAFALGQSALLGVGISSLYKVFTGRIPHSFRELTISLVDTSHQFQFGLYRAGAFQGWPSSHTTVAFAMAVTLVVLYPAQTMLQRIIRYGAIMYAFYIGIGVSTNIHWFSDFAAGAILGSIIGMSVGKAFFARLKN
jgi:membrane-associated phospholipid phosphatase